MERRASHDAGTSPFNPSAQLIHDSGLQQKTRSDPQEYLTRAQTAGHWNGNSIAVCNIEVDNLAGSTRACNIYGPGVHVFERVKTESQADVSGVEFRINFQDHEWDNPPILVTVHDFEVMVYRPGS